MTITAGQLKRLVGNVRAGCKLREEIGWFTPDGFGETAKAHVETEIFVELPGEVTTSMRNSNSYPLHFSKTVDGVEMYCICSRREAVEHLLIGEDDYVDC